MSVRGIAPIIDQAASAPPVKKEPKENKMKLADAQPASDDGVFVPRSLSTLGAFTQGCYARVVHKTAEVEGEKDHLEFIKPTNNLCNITFNGWITSELTPDHRRIAVLKVSFVFDKVWITDATDKAMALKGLKPIKRQETREVALYPDATTAFGITPQEIDALSKSPYRVQFFTFRN